MNQQRLIKQLIEEDEEVYTASIEQLIDLLQDAENEIKLQLEQTKDNDVPGYRRSAGTRRNLIQDVLWIRQNHPDIRIKPTDVRGSILINDKFHYFSNTKDGESKESGFITDRMVSRV